MREEGKNLIRETDTIYDIVNRYPILKDVLRKLSPRFRKLENPLIFNTAARVATVKDAARTGGIYLRELLFELNEAIGLGEEYLDGEKAKVSLIRDSFAGHDSWDPSKPLPRPGWADALEESEPLDVRLDTQDPFGKVTVRAEQLRTGEGFILVQKFVPIPLIRYLTGKGLSAWVSRADEEEYRVYIMKNQTTTDGGTE